MRRTIRMIDAIDDFPLLKFEHGPLIRLEDAYVDQDQLSYVYCVYAESDDTLVYLSKTGVRGVYLGSLLGVRGSKNNVLHEEDNSSQKASLSNSKVLSLSCGNTKDLSDQILDKYVLASVTFDPTQSYAIFILKGKTSNTLVPSIIVTRYDSTCQSFLSHKEIYLRDDSTQSPNETNQSCVIDVTWSFNREAVILNSNGSVHILTIRRSELPPGSDTSPPLDVFVHRLRVQEKIVRCCTSVPRNLRNANTQTFLRNVDSCFQNVLLLVGDTMAVISSVVPQKSLNRNDMDDSMIVKRVDTSVLETKLAEILGIEGKLDKSRLYITNLSCISGTALDWIVALCYVEEENSPEGSGFPDVLHAFIQFSSDFTRIVACTGVAINEIQIDVDGKRNMSSIHCERTPIVPAFDAPFYLLASSSAPDIAVVSALPQQEPPLAIVKPPEKFQLSCEQLDFSLPVGCLDILYVQHYPVSINRSSATSDTPPLVDPGLVILVQNDATVTCHYVDYSDVSCALPPKKLEDLYAYYEATLPFMGRKKILAADNVKSSCKVAESSFGEMEVINIETAHKVRDLSDNLDVGISKLGHILETEAVKSDVQKIEAEMGSQRNKEERIKKEDAHGKVTVSDIDEPTKRETCCEKRSTDDNYKHKNPKVECERDTDVVIKDDPSKKVQQWIEEMKSVEEGTDAERYIRTVLCEGLAAFEAEIKEFGRQLSEHIPQEIATLAESCLKEKEALDVSIQVTSNQLDTLREGPVREVEDKFQALVLSVGSSTQIRRALSSNLNDLKNLMDWKKMGCTFHARCESYKMMVHKCLNALNIMEYTAQICDSSIQDAVKEGSLKESITFEDHRSALRCVRRAIDMLHSVLAVLHMISTRVKSFERSTPDIIRPLPSYRSHQGTFGRRYALDYVLLDTLCMPTEESNVVLDADSSETYNVTQESQCFDEKILKSIDAVYQRLREVQFTCHNLTYKFSSLSFLQSNVVQKQCDEGINIFESIPLTPLQSTVNSFFVEERTCEKGNASLLFDFIQRELCLTEHFLKVVSTSNETAKDYESSEYINREDYVHQLEEKVTELKNKRKHRNPKENDFRGSLLKLIQSLKLNDETEHLEEAIVDKMDGSVASSVMSPSGRLSALEDTLQDNTRRATLTDTKIEATTNAQQTGGVLVSMPPLDASIGTPIVDECIPCVVDTESLKGAFPKHDEAVEPKLCKGITYPLSEKFVEEDTKILSHASPMKPKQDADFPFHIQEQRNEDIKEKDASLLDSQDMRSVDDNTETDKTFSDTEYLLLNKPNEEKSEIMAAESADTKITSVPCGTQEIVSFMAPTVGNNQPVLPFSTGHSISLGTEGMMTKELTGIPYSSSANPTAPQSMMLGNSAFERKQYSFGLNSFQTPSPPTAAPLPFNASAWGEPLASFASTREVSLCERAQQLNNAVNAFPSMTPNMNLLKPVSTPLVHPFASDNSLLAETKGFPVPNDSMKTATGHVTGFSASSSGNFGPFGNISSSFGRSLSSTQPGATSEFPAPSPQLNNLFSGPSSVNVGSFRIPDSMN